MWVGARFLKKYFTYLLEKLGNEQLISELFIYENVAMEKTIENYNFSMKFESGSLPEGIEKTNIHVSVLPGIDCKLPENAIPVSALYKIECQKELVKEVIVQVEHCAVDTTNLSFIVSSSSSLPYDFRTLRGGKYSDKYGTIQRNKFSTVANTDNKQSGKLKCDTALLCTQLILRTIPGHFISILEMCSFSTEMVSELA